MEMNYDNYTKSLWAASWTLLFSGSIIELSLIWLLTLPDKLPWVITFVFGLVLATFATFTIRTMKNVTNLRKKNKILQWLQRIRNSSITKWTGWRYLRDFYVVIFLLFSILLSGAFSWMLIYGTLVLDVTFELIAWFVPLIALIPGLSLLAIRIDLLSERIKSKGEI